jgi:DNA-binding XRE family transcriptional regulator
MHFIRFPANCPSGQEFIPHPECHNRHFSVVREKLDQKLARFLRKRRGTATYAEFSKKIGLRSSTLFRLENGEQSATLRALQLILDGLKCRMEDIFSSNEPTLKTYDNSSKAPSPQSQSSAGKSRSLARHRKA